MLPDRFSLKLVTLYPSFLGCFIVAVLMFAGAQNAGASVYQGFGATTLGGAQGDIGHVTNLGDFGPGSLREALSDGNRTVVFDVGGTIALSEQILVKGAFITIDGFTAPDPGITLTGAGLRIVGDDGAHDIIVQGIRIRDVGGDGITIRDSAYNIVIDHVSIQKASDGSIDVTRGAFDVTIQWSILAENAASHNFLSLVDYQALRVTYHHNLFAEGRSRNPHSGWDSTFATAPPDIVTDIRNNLIWDFIDYGTLIKNNTRANVVRNFYYSSTRPSAIRALRGTTRGQVYAEGNYSLNGADVDSRGNTKLPFAATAIDTTDACTAAQQVVAQAGARPLDAIDQRYLSMIMLPAAPCKEDGGSTGRKHKRPRKKKK